MSLLEPAHKAVNDESSLLALSCGKCGTYACTCRHFVDAPKEKVIPASVYDGLRSGLKAIQELASAYWSPHFYVPPSQMYASQSRLRAEGLSNYIKRTHGDLHQALVDLSAMDGDQSPVSPFEFNSTWLLEPVYPIDQHRLVFTDGALVPRVPDELLPDNRPEPPEDDVFTTEDVGKLARFAHAAMQALAAGDQVDAENLKFMAESSGLIHREVRVAPCGESCRCATGAGFPITCLRSTDLCRKAERLSQAGTAAVVTIEHDEHANRVLTDGAIDAIADVIHARITREGGYRKGMLKEALNSALRGTELPMDYSHEHHEEFPQGVATIHQSAAINDDELFRPSDLLGGHTAECNLSQADAREWSKGCSCPASFGASIDDSDTERLSMMCERGWMLKSFSAVGADCMATTGWQVLTLGINRKAFSVLAEVYRNDPRAAIDKAIERIRGVGETGVAP
jgi:hypothetical protein